MNAKHPGGTANAVCMLPPDAFEFVAPAESLAIETDPLAELGL